MHVGSQSAGYGTSNQVFTKKHCCGNKEKQRLMFGADENSGF